MKKIKVEDSLSQELGELQGQALLYDANGRALGLFSPMNEKLKVEELELEPPLSIEETEELRKRARANPGRPLQEILQEPGY